MSESIEIVEITDSSIASGVLSELKDISDAPPLELNLESTTTNVKRLLSDSESDPRSPKKLRIDEEDIIEPVVESESVIDDETTIHEGETLDDSTNDLSAADILEQNISFEKSVETEGDPILEETEEKPQEPEQDDDGLILEEIVSKPPEVIDEPDEAVEEEEEVEEYGLAEESMEYQESESEHSSEDENQDVLVMRAIVASLQRNNDSSKTNQPDDDEPIALDDSDDDAPNEPAKYNSDSEFSVDNQVINDLVESDEENEEAVLRTEPVKQHVSLARKLVKRSIRILSKKRAATKELADDNHLPIATASKVVDSLACTSDSKPKQDLKVAEVVELAAPIVSINKDEKTLTVEPMEVENTELTTKDEIIEKTRLEKAKIIEHNGKADKNQSEKFTANLAVPTLDKPNAKATDDSKISPANSNDSSRHESSLLVEISSCSIEEIFNRYVVKVNDHSPTLEEFSEELFYCLQQNKQEIEKAQQLWNEKLHVKYKIRELMETIRRHRAVTEIETFGYKPETAGNNSHPVISSKSSTTTNSETDHYEKHNRMSSESVNRLIQDVRASMLKRDEKQRVEDLAATGDGSFDNNSLASQWNSLQGAGAQGRQGQIIDVQSIINDFRQKNPQEIPRRGRRMKNSFGGGYYDQNSQADENRSFFSNASNNIHDYSNVVKNNSGSGYPEVSLHPVHNLYKNLSNSPGPSGGAHFGGQKSSLLQSILTKQSTKSPLGFHQNHSPLPSTSTLARLLTAPERNFQGTQAPKLTNQQPARQTSSSGKVHNNGEITITPIGLNNARNKDYSMDDEDNSLEPPLVIDESEDFDTGDRSNLKSVSDLLCQGCKKNKAFFMCAGCSRQWYCSKECQEMAWDDHAESCMI